MVRSFIDSKAKQRDRHTDRRTNYNSYLTPFTGVKQFSQVKGSPIKNMSVLLSTVVQGPMNVSFVTRELCKQDLDFR